MIHHIFKFIQILVTFRQAENDPERELEKGINWISSIHLKDTYPVTTESSGQFRDVPFGAGCVDFEGLLKKLKQMNYNGSFLIEMWSEKIRILKKEIVAAKSYLYPKLKEAGYEFAAIRSLKK